MGSLKSTSSTRCRYAGCFVLGFVVASLTLAAMFWIIWCYFGLTIVQISDTQRRALVNYSYTTAKPPTTSSPNNRTEVDGALESSLNAISKTSVTPPSPPRRRSDSSVDLAKGDFAARLPGGAMQNSTRRESISSSVTTSAHDRKASILSGGEESDLHPRKISTSNNENRAHEGSLSDIKPTQTYAPAQSDPLPTSSKDDRRPIARDSDRKDEIHSSKPSYRDPDFEREPPARRSQPGRRRYDDEDDYEDRGSASRYDKSDRGRDTDDRYSKGDTRVYPDERPRLEDRYPPRDSDRRRGDDRDREDRYRDRDDRYRDYDDRYKDRDDRYRYRDNPYRDEDKYRNDKPYLDEDRNQRRDRFDYDDRYSSKDDRYRYDDRYRPRDDRYRDDDDRYVYDDKRDRYIPRDDEDRYVRSRDRDYREPISSSRVDIPSDRKSGKPEDARRPTEYDIPVRDRPRISYIDESKTDDRYIYRDDDEFRRPSKYDDRDRISPTRTRDEAYISRSTVPISRSRDDTYKSGSSIIDERKRDDDRYSNNRDRPKYYDDDDRRIEESRYISPSSVRETDSTRKDVNRDDYRTRLPDDKKIDDVGIERRSYSAEEEEYRRQNSRTRYYDDTDRKPSGDSRRDYRTDDDYPRRTRPDDDEYRRSRPRGDYDTDKSRDPEVYDRSIDDDDRASRRYLPEYDEPRRRSDADTGLRKESYPRDVIDEDRMSRRPEGRRPLPPPKDRRYDDDIPPRRPISDDRPFRSRPDTIDDRPLRPAIDRASEDGRRYRDDTYLEDDRRYKDEALVNPDESSRYGPPRSEKREPFVSSPTSPRDTVSREKRYHNSGRTLDDYGNEEERPINTRDVIDAALKHSDSPVQNHRKVSYPIFDPRISNLTSPDFIPPSDRRGTTIMSRRRRSRTY
ncbi:eukaryotic translation initiation factor 3 subunit A-like [Argiope bruennichi]|uniref:eukaryotic translation initiation factor 3 subunit A-like n=1 Tax=Argiope bruennichi TaxID=94029 RepID=UPI002494654A|nr:eukaryotic translation initiation factor 3 subunit A-like [Argiope bruennichi]